MRSLRHYDNTLKVILFIGVYHELRQDFYRIKSVQGYMFCKFIYYGGGVTTSLPYHRR